MQAAYDLHKQVNHNREQCHCRGSELDQGKIPAETPSHITHAYGVCLPHREPAKSPGPFPSHLWEPLKRSFENDHYVDDHGDIVYYKRDASISGSA